MKLQLLASAALALIAAVPSAVSEEQHTNVAKPIKDFRHLEYAEEEEAIMGKRPGDIHIYDCNGHIKYEPCKKKKRNKVCKKRGFCPRGRKCGRGFKRCRKNKKRCCNELITDFFDVNGGDESSSSEDYDYY